MIVGEVPSASSLAAQMNQFTALGLEVAWTEIDIRMTLPSTSALLTQQSTDYQSMITACMMVEKCVGMTLWDFTDKYVSFAITKYEHLSYTYTSIDTLGFPAPSPVKEMPAHGTRTCNPSQQSKVSSTVSTPLLRSILSGLVTFGSLYIVVEASSYHTFNRTTKLNAATFVHTKHLYTLISTISSLRCFDSVSSNQHLSKRHLWGNLIRQIDVCQAYTPMRMCKLILRWALSRFGLYGSVFATSIALPLTFRKVQQRFQLTSVCIADHPDS